MSGRGLSGDNLPTLRSGGSNPGFVDDPFSVMTPPQVTLYMSVLSSLMFAVFCTAKRFADSMKAEIIEQQHLKLAGTHVMCGRQGLGRFYVAMMEALLEEESVTDKLKACAEPHPPPEVLATLATVVNFMKGMVEENFESMEGATSRMKYFAALETMEEFIQTTACCNDIPKQLSEAADRAFSEALDEAESTSDDDRETKEEEEEDTSAVDHYAMMMETAGALQTIKDHIESIPAKDLAQDVRYATSQRAIYTPSSKVEQLLFKYL